MKTKRYESDTALTRVEGFHGNNAVHNHVHVLRHKQDD